MDGAADRDAKSHCRIEMTAAEGGGMLSMEERYLIRPPYLIGPKLMTSIAMVNPCANGTPSYFAVEAMEPKKQQGMLWYAGSTEQAP